MTHRLPVRIYYEDTDFSGAVYHANYLKFFERAREHLLGPDALVRLWRDDGIGFVVYKASLTYREPAVFGDVLEIRTDVRAQSSYRLIFDQSVWRGERRLVEGEVQLACVDRANKLVPVPEVVMSELRARGLA